MYLLTIYLTIIYFGYLENKFNLFPKFGYIFPITNLSFYLYRCKNWPKPDTRFIIIDVFLHCFWILYYLESYEFIKVLVDTTNSVVKIAITIS
jgi:hypothetical protein